MAKPKFTDCGAWADTRSLLGDGHADQVLAPERHEGQPGLEMLLDLLERMPGGFRHARQSERDAAEADHREQREGRC